MQKLIGAFSVQELISKLIYLKTKTIAAHAKRKKTVKEKENLSWLVWELLCDLLRIFWDEEARLDCVAYYILFSSRACSIDGFEGLGCLVILEDNYRTILFLCFT